VIALAFSFFLWAVAIGLGLMVLRHSPGTLKISAKEGFFDFLAIMPRLAIGFLGSGFMAALIPQELIQQWLGEDSGLLGILVASLAGSLVPGGPVVGFSLGVAALKGGAAMAPVVAFVTAWALYAVQRILVWEIPFMPARLVWLRVIACLPLPVLAAYLVMLAQRWTG
jgi:uncharacterized membrane protein YraQ (UPF0718 family)